VSTAKDVLVLGGVAVGGYAIARHFGLTDWFSSAHAASPPSGLQPTPGNAPMNAAASALAMTLAPPRTEVQLATQPPLVALPVGSRGVWPLAKYEDRAPVISDGFGSLRPGALNDRHQGVDLMYGRIASDPWPPGSSNGTKAFVLPPGTLALALTGGWLTVAEQTDRGWNVVIDHGTFSSYYQHLAWLMVPITHASSAATAGRAWVRPGQPLGVVGYDPKDQAKLTHLHFEIWVPDWRHAVDPAPLLKTCELITSAQIDAFGLRNAKKKKCEGLQKVQGYERTYPGQALPWGRK
jgi:murein DD-endopeptidase MepM/ murein hydrolase activator NlpD